MILSGGTQGKPYSQKLSIGDVEDSKDSFTPNEEITKQKAVRLARERLDKFIRAKEKWERVDGEQAIMRGSDLGVYG